MQKHNQAFIKIAHDAKTKINETDVQTIKQKLDSNADFYLVDVREESEWARGHLPKAMHLSKGIIERDIEKTIPNFNTEIVLYCGGGFRSALTAENLQRMGYTNVWSMDGGYRGWMQAGYDLES